LTSSAAKTKIFGFSAPPIVGVELPCAGERQEPGHEHHGRVDVAAAGLGGRGPTGGEEAIVINTLPLRCALRATLWGLA
jgi:hypothetical protein